MWIKKQFGLRVLFTIMVFVAHACAKPHFAKQLNNADVEVVATWCPFLISISYQEDGGRTTNEETHAGLLGKYWLYSRTSSSICGLSPPTSISDEEMRSALRKAFGDREVLKSSTNDFSLEKGAAIDR